ncbi:hypothetical protein LCGC14_2008270 [marine sediment metagenome]|uniref:Uncharacterized protein n=1 Tax=marine sediment metagenome TaxID=412755 RepID=A0A0F9FNN6_9ZZZZ
MERVKNAPDFVRPGIYKLMEKRAKERGYNVITSEFLSEIRDESMKFASRRIKKLGLDELRIEAFDMAKLKLKSKKKKEVIDNIKGFLNDRTEKNTEIITKFKKYLSQEVNTSDDSLKDNEYYSIIGNIREECYNWAMVRNKKGIDQNQKEQR